MIVPKLTPLHWFVYRLLEECTLGNASTLSQREIYEKCLAAGHKVTWNENPANHNCHCRWLTKIADDLKFSLEVDKIVEHKDFQFYLCNRDEANALMQSYETKESEARQKKLWLQRKISRDSQGKVISNQCKPIDGKSNAKEQYETFNHGRERA